MSVDQSMIQFRDQLSKEYIMNKFIIILIFIFFLISAPASAKSHHRKHHQTTRHHIHHIVAKTKPPATQAQPTQNGASSATTKEEPVIFNQENFDSTEPNSSYNQETLPTEEKIESYFPTEGEEWPEVQPEEE